MATEDKYSSYLRNIARARQKVSREIIRTGVQVDIYRHVMDDDGYHGKLRAADKLVYEGLYVAIDLQGSTTLQEVRSDGAKVYKVQPTMLVGFVDGLQLLKNDYFVYNNRKYTITDGYNFDETSVAIRATLEENPLVINEGGVS